MRGWAPQGYRADHLEPLMPLPLPPPPPGLDPAKSHPRRVRGTAPPAVLNVSFGQNPSVELNAPQAGQPRL